MLPVFYSTILLRDTDASLPYQKVLPGLIIQVQRACWRAGVNKNKLE